MGSQIGGLIGGIWGDPGQNFVNLQGGPDKVFGTKPQVAPFTPVDLSAETQKAVSGDLSNYGDISALLDKVIPGFSDMLSQGTLNTQQELQGILPADVAAQTQRSAAYQALQGGYGGTGMAHALTARDLGLTSLNLTQMGTNAAQQWSQLAEQAYSPFTVSTGQQASTTAANNAGLQAQQQAQFNVNAAPDPGAAGVFQLDKALGQQALSFGLGVAGGAIAGGGASAALGATSGAQAGSGYAYNPGSGSYFNTTGVAGPSYAANWQNTPTWGGVG